MNILSYIKAIRQTGKRYFTINQAISDLGISRNYARVAIHRLLEQGDLISPAKGLYIIVPPEHQPYGSIPAEELMPILMKYLNANYYISLLSAAAFHGSSHQKPPRFQIITNKRIKHPLTFGQVKLEVIYKKSLSNLPLQDFTVATGYLKVASPELVSHDLLTYSEKSGGLNHIATVLTELIEVMNSNKLIEIADQLGEKAWLQRLGYILEKIDPMDSDKALQMIKKIEVYLKQKKLRFLPLAPELPTKGFARIKKWKIIENTDIESDI